MGGQSHIHLVVNIEPLWVVVDLIGNDRKEDIESRKKYQKRTSSAKTATFDIKTQASLKSVNKNSF